MKKIIISPFARKLREKDTPHPKEYPFWQELVSSLHNYHIIQIGVEGEKKLTDDCRFDLSSKEIINLVKECDLFISIDSFLPHLVHYNFKGKKSGIVLFGTSDPEVYGYPENKNLQKDKKYRRWDIFGPWEMTDPIPESFSSPAEVLLEVENCLK